MAADAGLACMAERRALTKRAQYLTVYRSGRAWADNLLVLKVLPNTLEISRFGFSVTKDVGQAVVRNRVRRLLREIVRMENVRPGWDIVVIARPAASTGDYHLLKQAMQKLLLRAGLIDRDETVRAGVN